jgi:hypothetical protein
MNGTVADVDKLKSDAAEKLHREILQMFEAFAIEI